MYLYLLLHVPDTHVYHIKIWWQMSCHVFVFTGNMIQVGVYVCGTIQICVFGFLAFSSDVSLCLLTYDPDVSFFCACDPDVSVFVGI